MCGKLTPIRSVCFHKEVVLTTGFLGNLVSQLSRITSNNCCNKFAAIQFILIKYIVIYNLADGVVAVDTSLHNGPFGWAIHSFRALIKLLHIVGISVTLYFDGESFPPVILYVAKAFLSGRS